MNHTFFARTLGVAAAVGLGLSMGATAQASPEAGHWQARTDGELAARVSALCEASLKDHKPVLLEFSAAWCGDCKAAAAFEQQPEVKAELANWHHEVIDVGRFERHQTLLKGFGAQGIAYWAALRPTDCAAAPLSWPRLRTGSVEPTSDASLATAAQLIGWLTEARAAKP